MEAIAVGLKELPCNNVQAFQFGEEPEKLYIIRTGFALDYENAYMVVEEDAYEMRLGMVEFMSRKTLEKKYGSIAGLVRK